MEQITFRIDDQTEANITSDIIQLVGDVKFTFETKDSYDGAVIVDVLGVEDWIPYLPIDETKVAADSLNIPTKLRIRVARQTTTGSAIAQLTGYNRQPFA